MQVVEFEQTRLQQAMNALDIFDEQMPKEILNIKKELQEEDEIRGGKNTIAAKFTGFQSVRFFMKGPDGSDRSVVLSYILYQEHTFVVVFEDLNKGLGRDSITRHYQPAEFLGAKSLDEMEAHVVDLKTKAALGSKTSEDYAKKVAEIDKGVGINLRRSNHYGTSITNHNLSAIHLDIFHYLKDGLVPQLNNK